MALRRLAALQFIPKVSPSRSRISIGVRCQVPEGRAELYYCAALARAGAGRRMAATKGDRGHPDLLAENPVRCLFSH